MKKSALFILCGILLLSSLTSCKSKKMDTSGKIKVLCTIFPQYDWTRQILTDEDDATTLSLLVKNGVDLHSYQPSAADIVQISTTDLFVYVGGESDAWVEDALANATNKNMKVINLMEVLQDNIKEEETVEGMQECEEEDSDDEEEVEYDEHVWLSIRNAELCCKAITEALCQIAPQNAEKYNANLKDYLEQLVSLDSTFKSVVNASKNKTLLFCDRFPFRYFVDDYGLNYYAAFSGCSAETEASFETVAFLATKLNELDLNSVCVLDRNDKKIAKTVILNAKKPRCDIYTFDSMQSVSLREAFNGKSYIWCMQQNLEALQKALN